MRYFFFLIYKEMYVDWWFIGLENAVVAYNVHLGKQVKNIG
jgi:hypothetical protein